MSEWVPPLADMILDDRVDRGVTPTRALERAEHYRRWLDSLSSPHDRRACPEEEKIRLWPGSLCFHKGQATVVVGSQGKGKTNLLAFLIERAIRHRQEWEIYSNIPFPWDEELAGIVPPPPRLHSISTMSELLRGIAQTVLAGREPAVVIDEMDQVATSHEWMTERSESWTKFLFVERHLRVWGPILAYHVREHVPLPLRANAALRGSYLRVIVRHGKHQFVRAEDPTYFGGIWESVLPFLTLGLRGFEIDVDMRELQTVARGSHRRVAELTLQVPSTDLPRAGERRKPPVARWPGSRTCRRRRSHMPSSRRRSSVVSRVGLPSARLPRPWVSRWARWAASRTGGGPHVWWVTRPTRIPTTMFSVQCSRGPFDALSRTRAREGRNCSGSSGKESGPGRPSCRLTGAEWRGASLPPSCWSSPSSSPCGLVR